MRFYIFSIPTSIAIFTKPMSVRANVISTAFLAGIKDFFFLGDKPCSFPYSHGNISLFKSKFSSIKSLVTITAKTFGYMFEFIIFAINTFRKFTRPSFFQRFLRMIFGMPLRRNDLKVLKTIIIFNTIRNQVSIGA